MSVAAADAFAVRRVDGALRLVGPGGAQTYLDVAEVRRRLQQGRRLSLAKACGVTGDRIAVLDAMAGLGLDGITLACLGCDVQMVERNALLYELLGDAIERARADLPVDGTIAARAADVRDLLDAGLTFDCIYFDPMFPARGKSALPRRSAQMLSQLLGPTDADLGELVACATPLARRRVVVKRRRLDPTAADADWTIVGRSVRFDVYRGRAPARS
jgi:16S rRNA (guanine1516-N2)-methyltransferase